jgi:hypothetical protein
MDVEPDPTTLPQNRAIILLYEKNFCGVTWEATARVLLSAGYRVILPLQILQAHYLSIQQLALNTKSIRQSQHHLSDRHGPLPRRHASHTLRAHASFVTVAARPS